jgi:hypothetical protein
MPADGETSYLQRLFVTGLVLVASLTSILLGLAPLAQSAPPTRKNAHIVENYGKLPLSFEVNTGQVDRSVKFLSRGSGYGLYMTGNQAALMVCQTVVGATRPDFQRKPSPTRKSAVCDVVRMQLAGANSKTEPMGEEQLQGTANYFIGNDPANLVA